MPELPDIRLYVGAMRSHLVGKPLRDIRLASPFLLRTVTPALEAFHGRPVESIEHQAKRLVLGFEGELFLVLHLMIAGRLRWKKKDAPITQRGALAAFDFDDGTLVLTEAGTKKRASLHAVEGRAGLESFDRGGLDPLTCTEESFVSRLRQENHTLKRALCDQRLFAGIGNAYSDEILHRARLSPFVLTQKLGDEEAARLAQAARDTLEDWIARLAERTGEAFPDKVTAFQEGMAVHGRFGEPCPDCGHPVQRIVYATKNEANYCAHCQTGGKILADRALSRLLKDSFPRRLEDLE